MLNMLDGVLTIRAGAFVDDCMQPCQSMYPAILRPRFKQVFHSAVGFVFTVMYVYFDCVGDTIMFMGDLLLCSSLSCCNYESDFTILHVFII